MVPGRDLNVWELGNCFVQALGGSNEVFMILAQAYIVGQLANQLHMFRQASTPQTCFFPYRTLHMSRLALGLKLFSQFG